ncbi:MAG: hypothetical protein LBI39_03965 [Puniceicoccales bacterium]|jgi:hypothetical protein|nr:hypothetical protein [Puniceicoccales bacterium]
MSFAATVSEQKLSTVSEFFLAHSIVRYVGESVHAVACDVTAAAIGPQIGGGVAIRTSRFGFLLYAAACILTVFVLPLVYFIFGRAASSSGKYEFYVAAVLDRAMATAAKKNGSVRPVSSAAVGDDELPSSPLAAGGPAGDERVSMFVEEDVAAAATVQGAASNGTPLPQQSAGGSSVSSPPASAPMQPHGAAAGSPLAPPAQGGSASPQPQLPIGSGGAAGQPAAAPVGGSAVGSVSSVGAAAGDGFAATHVCRTRKLKEEPYWPAGLSLGDFGSTYKKLVGRFFFDDPNTDSYLEENESAIGAARPSSLEEALDVSRCLRVDCHLGGEGDFECDIFDKNMLCAHIFYLIREIAPKRGGVDQTRVGLAIGHLIDLYYLDHKYLFGGLDVAMYRSIMGDICRPNSIGGRSQCASLVKIAFGAEIAPCGDDPSLAAASVVVRHIQRCNPAAIFRFLLVMYAERLTVAANEDWQYFSCLRGEMFVDWRQRRQNGSCYLEDSIPINFPVTWDGAAGEKGLAEYLHSALVATLADFGRAAASPIFSALLRIGHYCSLLRGLGVCFSAQLAPSVASGRGQGDCFDGSGDKRPFVCVKGLYDGKYVRATDEVLRDIVVQVRAERNRAYAVYADNDGGVPTDPSGGGEEWAGLTALRAIPDRPLRVCVVSRRSIGISLGRLTEALVFLESIYKGESALEVSSADGFIEAMLRVGYRGSDLDGALDLSALGLRELDVREKTREGLLVALAGFLGESDLKAGSRFCGSLLLLGENSTPYVVGLPANIGRGKQLAWSDCGQQFTVTGPGGGSAIDELLKCEHIRAFPPSIGPEVVRSLD